MRLLIPAALAVFLSGTAWAQEVQPVQEEVQSVQNADTQGDAVAQNTNPATGANAPGSPSSAPQAHPAAIPYSDAYQTRLKIHKYASYATLPLFATQLALGQSLYNNPNEGGAKKGLHGAVGAGIVGLF